MEDVKPGYHPILFIPSVETFDPELKNNKIRSEVDGTSMEFKGVQARNDSRIIFVFKDVESTDGLLFPGYTVSKDGSHEFYGMISEDFAWNNNVWVIGYEEKVSVENMVSNKPNASIKKGNTTKSNHTTISDRYPTSVEYGGRIHIPKISDLESWIDGALEMKYFVHDSFGKNIKERAFGKTSRSTLDNRWHDFNDLIGNWDVSIWGPFHYERWIEEDGGDPVTITYPVTPFPGGTTYTISTTMRDDDDNLGLSPVGYNDNYYFEIPLAPSEWRVYNISYMNFQRTSVFQP